VPGRTKPVVSWKWSQSTSYVDPTGQQFRDQFNEQFDVVQWYHWLSSITNPAAQAEHWLQSLGTVRSAERHSIDAEEKGVTAEQVVAHATVVEAETKVPSIVYTGLYVDGGRIWRSPEVRMSAYGPRPMHLAAYVSASNLITRVNQLGVADQLATFWQYSSNGPVPGVTGRADMNHVCDWSPFALDTPIAADPSGIPVVGPTSSGDLVTAVQYFLLVNANQKYVVVNGTWDANTTWAWATFVKWINTGNPGKMTTDGYVSGVDWDVIAYIAGSWEGLYTHGYPRPA